MNSYKNVCVIVEGCSYECSDSFLNKLNFFVGLVVYTFKNLNELAFSCNNIGLECDK